MSNKIKLLMLTFISAIFLTACDVEVEDPGKLPDVDVDADPGRLPDVNVDAKVPDVDVEMKKKEVTVPDVDIDMEGDDPDVE